MAAAIPRRTAAAMTPHLHGGSWCSALGVLGPARKPPSAAVSQLLLAPGAGTT
jgi:hypothetical protein